MTGRCHIPRGSSPGLLPVLDTALLLALVACGGEPNRPASATPAGTYRVANVAEAVALAHAHQIESIEEVVRALGKGVTQADVEAGYAEVRKVDAALTERLTTARVTLHPEGTFTWSPAPILLDEMSGQAFAGRWSMTGNRVALDFERLDELPFPGRLRVAADWDGDLLRLGTLEGMQVANTGVEGVLLRREPR